MKIYEYQPTMMHAKSMVVDGMWSYVGSMNFDNRSLSFNDESLLLALDRRIGGPNGLDLHGRPQVVEGDQTRRVPKKRRSLREDSRVGGAEAEARALAPREWSSGLSK